MSLYGSSAVICPSVAFRAPISRDMCTSFTKLDRSLFLLAQRRHKGQTFPRCALPQNVISKNSSENTFCKPHLLCGSAQPLQAGSVTLMHRQSRLMQSMWSTKSTLRIKTRASTEDGKRAVELDVAVFRFTLGIPGFDDGDLPRVVGVLCTILIALNHYFSQPATGSISAVQLRSEVLGFLLAGVAIALPSLGVRLKEAAGGRRALDRAASQKPQVFALAEETLDAFAPSVRQELGWATYALLRNTNASLVMLWREDGMLCLRGSIEGLVFFRASSPAGAPSGSNEATGGSVDSSNETAMSSSRSLSVEEKAALLANVGQALGNLLKANAGLREIVTAGGVAERKAMDVSLDLLQGGQSASVAPSSAQSALLLPLRFLPSGTVASPSSSTFSPSMLSPVSTSTPSVLPLDSPPTSPPPPLEALSHSPSLDALHNAEYKEEAAIDEGRVEGRQQRGCLLVFSSQPRAFQPKDRAWVRAVGLKLEGVFAEG
eukprot:TRINITY_DN19046_c0_g1_i1.p1 TRINITY_DN19046_c0_g1~~TRINITY_DN19046_c0_g1_i1.p1  ORF type:complete len:489 (+),score=65.02 TRINITY_DN19046_c0_g1_i1:449-1915(+)